MCNKSGKKSIPREKANQNIKMKITNWVLLNLFMRDNEECNVSHAPWQRLKLYTIFKLHVLEPLCPKDQEYNNTEMKSGCHKALNTLCCGYKDIKILVKSRYLERERPNQNKEMKIADTVLLSLIMRANEECKDSHVP